MEKIIYMLKIMLIFEVLAFFSKRLVIWAFDEKDGIPNMEMGKEVVNQTVIRGNIITVIFVAPLLAVFKVVNVGDVFSFAFIGVFATLNIKRIIININDVKELCAFLKLYFQAKMVLIPLITLISGFTGISIWTSYAIVMSGFVLVYTFVLAWEGNDYASLFMSSQDWEEYVQFWKKNCDKTGLEDW